jgi:hypothetical protein
MTIQVLPPPGNPPPDKLASLPAPTVLPTPSPADSAAAWGWAVVFEGQDSRARDELFQQVSATVKPRDFLEKIWVDDFVYNQMEIQKLRQIKNLLPNTAIQDALIKLLSLVEDVPSDVMGKLNFADLTTSERLVRDWSLGEIEAIERVNKLLSSQPGMSIETAKARAFSNELQNLTRIDHLLTTSEQRRDANLREIDRHRAAFGRKLRGTLKDIEDAEFETIEQNAVSD